MRLESQGPLEAVVIDDWPPPPKRRAWPAWLFAIGAFTGFVALFGGLLWGLGKLLDRPETVDATRADSLVQHWESPDERLAALQTGFSTDDAATAAERRELERFFSRLTEALYTPQAFTGISLPWQTPASFEDYVDYHAWSDRVVRHPLLAESQGHPRRRMEAQFRQRMEAPVGWSEFALVGATRNRRGDELIAYTIGLGGSPAPIRWWLRRDGRSWRICDWEVVTRGGSEASIWAALQASDADPQLGNYRQIVEAVKNARETSGRWGNNVQAMQRLIAVDGLPCPPLLNDQAQVELALAWQQCGRPDKAHAACDQVQDWAAHAGVHFVRALAYADDEQYAEAAEAAAEYRRLAGAHPHLLAVEADALEALGRSDEARERWLDRWRLMPSDIETIRQVCRLSGDAEDERIAATLRRVRKAVECAEQVAERALYDHDDATFRRMLALLEAHSAPASKREGLLAKRLEWEDEYAKAAEQFRLAAEHEQRADMRPYWRSRYLAAMAHDGQALAGYLAADDAREAFAALTEDFEYDEGIIAPEDLPDLVAAHRRRDPDDPRLAYFEAWLLIEADQPAEAEQILAAAVAAGGQDLAGSLRELLRTALVKQGKLREALEVPSEYADAFITIASDLESRRDWPQLGTLLNLQRQRKPGDVWIYYYEATREQGLGNDAAALAAIQRVNTASDDHLRYRLESLKTDLLLRTGAVREAYRSSGMTRDGFRTLAMQLSQREAWDELRQIADMHLAARVQGAVATWWLAKAHFEQGDYAKVCELMLPWNRDRAARLDADQQAELHDLLARSLVREGRLDEAAEAAARALDECGLAAPAVMVAVARGDAARARALLEEPWIARSIFERQLHHDRELAVLLTDPEFADLRRRHAVGRLNDYGLGRLSLVLLYEFPPSLDELRQQAATLADLGTPQEVAGSDGRTSLAWHQGGAALLVTHRQAPYVVCTDYPEMLSRDDERLAALVRHSGWVAIDVLSPGDPKVRDALERRAGDLAARLASGASLVYASPSRRQDNRLAMVAGPTSRELADGTFWTKAAVTDSVYLYEWDDHDRRAAGWNERQRLLGELARRARVERDEGYALVRIVHQRGHAKEDAWLKVVRSKRGEYGTEELIVAATAPSRLWPHLTPGERLRAAWYHVEELRQIEPGRDESANRHGQ